MIRALAALRAAARFAAALLMAGVVGIVSWSAIGRYFFNAPIRFAEEATGLLMIGMLFLAIAGAGMPAHIRVGLLADALPAKARAAMRGLALGVLVAFCLVFGWEAIQQLRFNYLRNIKSEIMGWPLWPWAAVIPAALLVLLLDSLFSKEP